MTPAILDPSSDFNPIKELPRQKGKETKRQDKMGRVREGLKTLLFIGLWLHGLAEDAVVKYNVLFILVDDLKPTLGVYGDLGADTPNIDRIFNKGLRFENANTQKSECAPSRMSMFTSHRNDELEMWGFTENFRKLHPTMVTMPGFLRQNGYRTVGIGKNYDNRYFGDSNMADVCSSASDENCSFDEVLIPNTFYDGPDPLCNGTNALRWPTNDPSVDQSDSNKFLSVTWEFDDTLQNRHLDYCISDVAQQRLKELAASGSPFFLGVGFAKPHLPWVAPASAFEPLRQIPDHVFEPPPSFTTLSDAIQTDPFWNQDNDMSRVRSNSELQNYGGYDQLSFADRARGYYAAVKFLDQQVGALIKVFEEDVDPEVQRNTMVIFWGDHGYHLGDHNVWCKKTIHEHGARVPLAFVPPAAYVAANRDINPDMGNGLYTLAPVDSVDIFPTILDMTGLRFTSKLAGTSLVPLMENPSTYIRSAAVSQYESYSNKLMGYSVRTYFYRLIVFFKTNNKGYIESLSPSGIELYRLNQPGNVESENLADDPAFQSVRDSMLSIIKDPRNSNSIPNRDWTHLWEIDTPPFDIAMQFMQ